MSGTAPALADGASSSPLPPTMFHSRTHIQEGDLVIVFLTRSDYLALTMKAGAELHNRYGRYKHSDIIGLRFGSKVISSSSTTGYIYVLRPTPELWTKSLPHRTQIVYQPDISYITMRLGIRVGGKVLEAGTGSGSMTHSLSRIVGDRGYVGSYEYHQTRYFKAREEFEAHGLANVRLQHRNVCKDGFGDVQDVEAVFLDLPAPWEAIPHVLNNLRTDITTKICCFSPCMEQVTKTCSALRAAGFGEVSTQEVLIRTYELPSAPPNGSKPLRDISSIVSDLAAHEKKKADRRAVQMKNARERSAAIKAKAAKAKEAEQKEAEAKVQAHDEGKEAEQEAAQDADEGARQAVVGGEQAVHERTQTTKAQGSQDVDIDISPAVLSTSESREQGKRKMDDRSEPSGRSGETTKKARLDESAESHHDTVADAAADVADEPADSDLDELFDADDAELAAESKVGDQHDQDASISAAKYTEPASSIHNQILLRIQPEMRGHTSYLTFASLAPLHIREALAAQGEKAAVDVSADDSAGPSNAGQSGNTATNGRAEATVTETSAEKGAREGTGAGHSGIPASVSGSLPVSDDKTETDGSFVDKDLDQKLGTMTEEEMIAMLQA